MDNAPSAPMPQYQCHKKVWALKISAVDRVAGQRHGDDPSYRLVVEDKGFAPILVTKKWVDKHSPTVGGYYVVYEDGYKSFSPAEAFESGYTLIED